EHLLGVTLGRGDDEADARAAALAARGLRIDRHRLAAWRSGGGPNRQPVAAGRALQDVVKAAAGRRAPRVRQVAGHAGAGDCIGAALVGGVAHRSDEIAETLSRHGARTERESGNECARDPHLDSPFPSALRPRNPGAGEEEYTMNRGSL